MNIETECFKKVVIVIYKEELQMEKKLNALLSDLVVEYHKLQSFHWYLKGSHFFDDHAKLESFYDEIAEAVDAVAEAMLQQKLRPESTLKGFLAKTGIHEAENEEVTSKEAYTVCWRTSSIFLKKSSLSRKRQRKRRITWYPL